MSTPPLVTLPTSSCFANITMGLTRVVGLTASPFTLEDQAFKWPGEAWSASVNLPAIRNAGIAADWKTFGLKLQGMYGHFLLGDPLAKQPRGVATGTPLVNGGGQSGGTLLTKGWTPNTTGILLAGDYIQLGSGVTSKLHMNLEDVNSDASGFANLSLAPDLRNSPADNAPITIINARGLFRLTNNSWDWSVDPGGIYRFSFEAAEVVNA